MIYDGRIYDIYVIHMYIHMFIQINKYTGFLYLNEKKTLWLKNIQN